MYESQTYEILTPRILDLKNASNYLGVSTNQFIQKCAERNFPQPIIFDGKLVWDRKMLTKYMKFEPV